MSEPESPDFTVTDRRHAAPSDPATEPNTDADTKTEADSTAEPPEKTQEMPDPAFLLSYVAMQMDTFALADALLAVFDSHAWRSLGFVSDPRYGETRKDLPSAQLAIDCLRLLLEKVGDRLPSDEKRDAQRRLNDLQMNYLARMREN